MGLEGDNTMHIKRLAQHLLMTNWRVKQLFPRHTLRTIEQAIKASETTHLGEIRFVVEGALDGTPLFKGQSARDRAIEVFAQLRIWDTEYNNGVLIYLLLADRAVEIVADRGLHAKVGAPAWEQICSQMETSLQQANYEGGVLSGVQAVTQHLVAHFPADGGGQNALPDAPVIL